MKKTFATTSLLISTLFPLYACSAAETPTATLQPVASFKHQVTGVAVSKDGRIFVNFPRWTEDSPVSVAELKGNDLIPYPNGEWNAWRNKTMDKITPGDHFVCVQSVVMDKQNHLWVVDPAAPGNDRIVKGGPKLVQIDIATNKVTKIIPFDEEAAPQGSYLNDVRFSPDGKYAYMTDSGKGALIVVNIESGKIRRLLEEDPAVLAEKGLVVKIDGEELRRPDGRTPIFNADGIALSADGGTLYWQALSGKTLYSLPTSAIRDETLSPEALKTKVATAGKNGVADGLWIDEQDRMYVSSPEENAVKIRVAMSSPVTLVNDKGLRWPDSFAEGADGSIYITSSHIPDMPWFKPDADKAVATELWKISLKGEASGSK